MIISEHDHEKVESILENTCKLAGYSREELVGPGRVLPLVRARWAAMAAIRRGTDLGTADIGELFNRDHSSVVHALNAPKTSDFLKDVDDLLLGVEPKKSYTPDPSVEEATRLLLDAQEMISRATATLAKVNTCP